MSEITYKICSKCKKEQPINQFHPDIRYRDGYMSTCKSCKRENAKQYLKEHPEYRLKKKLKHKMWYDKQKTLRDSDNILGGWKITVPNYVKRGEYKFNAVSTNGEVFRTNTFTDFLDWFQNQYGAKT